MKIKNVDNKIVVYLDKKSINDIDKNDIDDLENYFQRLFNKIKKYINIELKGFYNISIYIDYNIGTVIEIEKEDLEFISYYNNQIDMKIIKYESIFLFKVDDILNLKKEILKKINLYFYKNNYYIEIVDKLSKKEITSFLEFVNLIYDTNDILEYGKKITNML